MTKNYQVENYKKKLSFFLTRYLLFLLLISCVGSHVTPYIEIPLLNLSQMILSLFTELPIEKLYLDQSGQLLIEIIPLKYFPYRNALDKAFFVLLPLLFATSARTFRLKQRMVLWGVVALSLLEVSYVILDIYEWILANYSFWAAKGIDIRHIIKYQEKTASFFIFFSRFLKRIHSSIIIGIWIWICFKCKREKKLMDAIL